MSDKRLEPARHEPSDVGATFIWSGVALLTTSVLLLAFIVLWLFPGATTDRTMILPLPKYPEPRLQQNPAADMARFRRHEMRRLNSAGWIDGARRVAHIPIADAMQQIVQEGIPDWPGAAQPPALAQQAKPTVLPPAAASREKTREASHETPHIRPSPAHRPHLRNCEADARSHRNCLPAKSRRPTAAADHAPQRKRPRPSTLRSF
jgi:hypothetical protein